MLNNRRKQLTYDAPPVRVLSPELREAERLIAAGVPPEEWSDEVLNAFCDESPLPLRQWFEALTDQELDDYAAQRPGVPVMPPEIRALVREV